MLLVCRRCATRFAVGLPYCPQCTSTDCYQQGEEEGEMPKATVHGGPSNADETVAAAGETGAETAVAADPTTEDGEQPSPGNSSSASDEKPSSSPGTSRPGRRQRARTTGNRSGPDPKDDSPARGGTTSSPETGEGDE